MKRIIAFDPGKITGVAIWDDVYVGRQFTVEELYSYVDHECDSLDGGHVQVEKFTISQATIRKAAESDPLDVIGYLKYAAWRCGFEIGWSKPADVMKTFPDASLKKAGMFIPGKGHANDAARHLAWYLVKNKIRPAGDFLL
jgi:hypothetical protein